MQFLTGAPQSLVNSPKVYNARIVVSLQPALVKKDNAVSGFFSKIAKATGGGTGEEEKSDKLEKGQEVLDEKDAKGGMWEVLGQVALNHVREMLKYLGDVVDSY